MLPARAGPIDPWRLQIWDVPATACRKLAQPLRRRGAGARQRPVAPGCKIRTVTDEGVGLRRRHGPGTAVAGTARVASLHQAGARHGRPVRAGNGFRAAGLASAVPVPKGSQLAQGRRRRQRRVSPPSLEAAKRGRSGGRAGTGYCDTAAAGTRKRQRPRESWDKKRSLLATHAHQPRRLQHGQVLSFAWRHRQSAARKTCTRCCPGNSDAV